MLRAQLSVFEARSQQSTHLLLHLVERARVDDGWVLVRFVEVSRGEEQASKLATLALEGDLVFSGADCHCLLLPRLG